MKKTNLKVLLVALSSVFALAACNSGSSSNPSPAPSPSPTVMPTTTPSPTPSPVPPVTTESGIYVQGTGFTYTFSTAPSKGTWYQYTTAAATGNNFDVAVTSGGILSLNAGGFLYLSTNGSSFTQLNTTALTTPVVQGSTQIITGGTNSVVFTPTAAAATSQIVAVTPAGVVTQAPTFTNSDGTTTAPTLTATSVITEFGGTYYLFLTNQTAATANTVYTSTDGKTWVYAAAPTANILANTITKIGSTYYAVTSTGTVVSGTSPIALTTATNLTSNGGTNNDINGSADGLFTDGTNLYVHTSAAVNGGAMFYFGNGVTQQASAQGTLANFPVGDSLMFVGSTVYEYTPDGTFASLATVKPVTQTGTVLTPGTAASVTGDTFAVSGSNLIVANPKVGAAARTAGGVDVVSAVSSTGVSTYSALPVNTTGVGFAGTPSNYMMIGANGAAVLNSGTTLVPVATVLNNSAAGTATAATARPLRQPAYAGRLRHPENAGRRRQRRSLRLP